LRRAFCCVIVLVVELTKNSAVLFTFAEIYDTMKLLKILIRRRRLK
jgi:hypothetical protein